MNNSPLSDIPDFELRLRQLVRPLPHGHSLAIFYLPEIINELTNILAAIHIEHQPTEELTAQQWSTFITDFVACFGSLPAGTDAVTHALQRADGPLVTALAERLLKTIHALNRIPDMMGARFPGQVVLLLPATFAQRLDMLLGEGRLPIAQITQFDVLKF